MLVTCPSLCGRGTRATHCPEPQPAFLGCTKPEDRSDNRFQLHGDKEPNAVPAALSVARRRRSIPSLNPKRTKRFFVVVRESQQLRHPSACRQQQVDCSLSSAPPSFYRGDRQ